MVKETVFPKGDKGIQDFLECIKSDSIDYFSVFRNERG